MVAARATGVWVAAASSIANVGFRLVQDVHGGGSPAGSHLVIALRERPTLAHFDPDRVTWWATVDGRWHEVEFRRQHRLPEGSAVGWGRVRAIDRLAEQEAFLTFGGHAYAVGADPAMTIVVLESAAPILRWAGHMQGSDPLTAEVGAFFARLRARIGVRDGAEARIAQTTPLAMYAAFVADLHARYRRARRLRDAYPETSEWLVREARGIESTRSDEWDEGRQMLFDLALLPAAAVR